MKLLGIRAMACAALSIGLMMGSFVEGAVGKYVNLTVNADYLTPGTSSVNYNNQGDTIRSYVNLADNFLYVDVWEYNNDAVNTPQQIVDASTLQTAGRVAVAISPNGDYRAIVWTDSTAGELFVSVDSGSGFTQLPAVPLPSPVLGGNQGFIAVSNTGTVAVINIQDANGGTEFNTYASIWNGTSWSQTLLALGDLTLGIFTNATLPYVDPNGNFYFAWVSIDVPSSITTTVYSTIYNAATASLAPTTTVDAITDTSADPFNIIPLAALSPSGSAYSIVLQLPHGVAPTDPVYLYSWTFRNNAWSTFATLTPATVQVPVGSNFNSFSFPIFAVNDSGYAEYGYSSLIGGTYTLYSALTLGSQVTLVPVISSTNELRNITSSIDQFGNAALLYQELDPPGAPISTQVQNINVAARSGHNGTWQTPLTLASDTSFVGGLFPFTLNINNQEAIISQYGHIAVDGVGAPLNWDQFTVNVLQNIFLPQSGVSFLGVGKKTKFATQTDYNNVLTWSASLDPTVVSYNIYRDGVLIGNVLATSPLTFIDHNRRKNTTYTYQLVGVNSLGVSGAPLTITVRSAD